MTQVNTMEIYRALSRLARRYQFRSRDEICCYGLTVSQCYALEILAESDLTTMTTLSSDLGLDLSSTTRLVDELVRKKLATRQRGEEDARVRVIRVTDAGKRLVVKVQQDLVSLLDRALADLPSNVLEALPAALKRITVALNECCEVPEMIPSNSIRAVAR